MKLFKLAVFSLLLCSVGALAQYNNPYGSSRINRMPTNERPTQVSPEVIEKNKNEKIDKLMANLKTELKLDDLQYIAIRNEIVSNSKSVDIVLKKENSDEDKSTEIKAMMERTEVKINSYLNAEQKDKYKALIVAGRSGKKNKKDKKEDLKPEEEIKQ